MSNNKFLIEILEHVEKQLIEIFNIIDIKKKIKLFEIECNGGELMSEDVFQYIENLSLSPEGNKLFPGLAEALPPIDELPVVDVVEADEADGAPADEAEAEADEADEADGAPADEEAAAEVAEAAVDVPLGPQVGVEAHGQHKLSIEEWDIMFNQLLNDVADNGNGEIILNENKNKFIHIKPNSGDSALRIEIINSLLKGYNDRYKKLLATKPSEGGGKVKKTHKKKNRFSKKSIKKRNLKKRTLKKRTLKKRNLKKRTLKKRTLKKNK